MLQQVIDNVRGNETTSSCSVLVAEVQLDREECIPVSRTLGIVTVLNWNYMRVEWCNSIIACMAEVKV